VEKQFASQADLAEKKISFTELADGVYAYTAERDPNTGMPFDVSRAYDEATQYPDPRVWTAQPDKELWEALEGLRRAQGARRKARN